MEAAYGVAEEMRGVNGADGGTSDWIDSWRDCSETVTGPLGLHRCLLRFVDAPRSPSCIVTFPPVPPHPCMKESSDRRPQNSRRSGRPKAESAAVESPQNPLKNLRYGNSRGIF